MLFDEFNASEFPTEPVVVVGIVHPLGPGAQVNMATEKPLTLRFRFKLWRGEDHILHTNILPIFCDVTKEEYEGYRKQIQPFGILTTRIIFTKSGWAELLEILERPIEPDDPLRQLAAELQKPKTHQHKRFGTLTFDSTYEHYGATVTWAGKSIELILEAEEEEQLEAALDVALNLWNDQTMWNNRILDFTVQEKLDLYNDIWREDDDPELTPEEFKSRISLATVCVYPGGEFEFHYGDGDLFASHMIAVSGSLRDGLTEAKI